MLDDNKVSAVLWTCIVIYMYSNIFQLNLQDILNNIPEWTGESISVQDVWMIADSLMIEALLCFSYSRLLIKTCANLKKIKKGFLGVSKEY